MNFAHMPELESPYGYPIVVLVILASAVTLHRMLRRAGWL
jgi:magnesium transporter